MGSLVPGSIDWRASAFDLRITINEHGAPCIESFVPHGETRPKSSSPWFEFSSLPLNGVRSVGEGNTMIKTCKSLIGN